MSVKSRSDMMIKINKIWFLHLGIKLTPNPSERDLHGATQEHIVPPEGPRPWLVPAKVL